jgi:2-iminobutanoate/2-iminopropanoate deaminase
MNRRVGILLAALAVAGVLTVRGAFSEPKSVVLHKAINLQGKAIQAPFSDAILAGNTLYLSGRIGLDPKTGKVPESVDDEIKLLLDGDKAVLEQAGMSMNDIVYVQVYCTDLSLYDKFNAAYRSYFSKDFPARAFIGAGSLLRGGHFELQAIAVKK